jgi:hypothetical protein
MRDWVGPKALAEFLIDTHGADASHLGAGFCEAVVLTLPHN